MSEPAPTIAPELASHIEGGIAIVVATRDADMRPQITRAWGAGVAADGSALTICVTAAEGSRTLANLRANGAIALTFSSPTTYRTVQAKGVVTDLRQPSESDLARRDEHLEDFLDQGEQVGIEQRKRIRRLARSDSRPAQVAGETLHLQCQGDGTPTVVLLGGQGASISTWKTFAPRSATACARVSVDARRDPQGVVARTGSGNVAVTVSRGSYALDAITDSGTLRVDGIVRDDRAPKSIVARTTSGNVSLMPR